MEGRGIFHDLGPILVGLATFNSFASTLKPLKLTDRRPVTTQKFGVVDDV